MYKKNLRYLHKGLNDKTQRNFWVFERSEELNDALTEWSQNK